MELPLLAASLRSRTDYDLVRSYIDPKLTAYSKPFQVVLAKVGDYYSRDPDASHVVIEVLNAQIAEAIRSDKHVQMFQQFIEQSVASTGSDINVRAAILLAKQQEVADQAAAVLVEKGANSPEAGPLLEELNRLRSLTSLDELEEHGLESFHNIDIAGLVETEYDPDNIIKLYPLSLNERVENSAKKGHHITVYGRPEVSKSATCINMNCGFARQGKRSIYFINEDRPQDIIIRHVSNLSGMTKNQIHTDPHRAQDLAEEVGYGNIMVVSCAPGTPRQIMEYVEKFNPDCIIVDQLRNLKVRADTRVNQLEQAATQIRNIAKEMNVLAVSVTQAGDSANNKAVLEMGDVDFSNCLAEGQLVRMFNGDIRRVETLRVGEQVMGMDSTPRTITKIGEGIDNLYRIKQKDGKSYEVNSKHILTVKKTTSFKWIAEQGTILDKPLQFFLDNPSATGHLKGISAGVEYTDKELILPPYFLGLWLADGSKNKPQICTKDKVLLDWCLHFAQVSGMTTSVRFRKYDECYYITFKDKSIQGQNKISYLLKQLKVWNDKHIPFNYRTASRKQRLQLLAGLIDGDGYLSTRNKNQYYEIAAYQFQNDILELCWGLGFKASLINGNRIYISGNLTSIPCKLERKKATQGSTRDVLCSRISIEPMGVGKYYGITVDGDQRYLLANFIVTHNTGIPAQADLMIGIGMDAALEAEGLRVFSLPKNKLSGRHENWPVRLIPQLSRVTSV